MSAGSDHRRVRIYEVGPRDGLQNESEWIPTGTKLRFIELLIDAGLREIEATSFVSPRAIPQLADADELFSRLPRRSGVRFPVLVPNERGLVRAEAAGVDAIAVFTAATDAFTQHNIGMTVDESIAAFRPVLSRATELGWWRRAYVSTAFGCPYTGRVEPAAAVAVAERLLGLGVDESKVRIPLVRAIATLASAVPRVSWKWNACPCVAIPASSANDTSSAT